MEKTSKENGRRMGVDSARVREEMKSLMFMEERRKKMKEYERV